MNKQSYLYCRDALPLNNNVAQPQCSEFSMWTMCNNSWQLCSSSGFCAAEHMTQDSRDVNKKRGEETVAILAAPESWTLQRKQRLGSPCCLHERVILERFSSRRWLTTLTTHSALFQHIMMWLMCVDEGTALSAAAIVNHSQMTWTKNDLGSSLLSRFI